MPIAHATPHSASCDFTISNCSVDAVTLFVSKVEPVDWGQMESRLLPPLPTVLSSTGRRICQKVVYIYHNTPRQLRVRLRLLPCLAWSHHPADHYTIPPSGHSSTRITSEHFRCFASRRREQVECCRSPVLPGFESNGVHNCLLSTPSLAESNGATVCYLQVIFIQSDMTCVGYLLSILGSLGCTA